MTPAQFLFQGVAFNYIVYGKAVLLSRNYIQLEILTGEFKHYFFRLAESTRLSAQSDSGRGGEILAFTAWMRVAHPLDAISMAREDHILPPFAEYASAIIEMVRSLRHAHPRTDT